MMLKAKTWSNQGRNKSMHSPHTRSALLFSMHTYLYGLVRKKLTFILKIEIRQDFVHCLILLYYCHYPPILKRTYIKYNNTRRLEKPGLKTRVYFFPNQILLLSCIVRLLFCILHRYIMYILHYNLPITYMKSNIFRC